MPYVGDFLIFAATVSVLLSMTMYLLVKRGKDGLLNLARGFYVMSGVMITSAISVLMYLILTHDFSVAYVYSYSSSDLPLGYLISTLWGGQEGTFLLWIFFTVIMGLIMMVTAKDFEYGNMVVVNLFLLSILIILLKKSPFELLQVAQSEGAGLNPLLQNFWMQIHPPIMFLGFSGALFPFAFGMTALIERKYNSWAESARRWTMFAWISLGTSLVMGGYWAYLTLGWGGFWAWDPVENSSFIPWIFLAAQVHVLFIKRVRQGLMRFSIFMVSLSFWSVLYGTFLTRSGVLADFSVHSFVDLGLNNFLIGGLLFFFVMGISLLIWRWRDIKPNASYSQVASRSYLVTLGIVILFIGGALTLIGTSSPLLTRMAENPSAVEQSYYFITMTPVAIALMLLMGMFPAFRWNKGLSKPKLLAVGFSAMIITILGLILTGFTYSVMYLMFFGAATMAIVTNLYTLYLSYRKGSFTPGYLAHIGLALAMIGAGVSAGFENKKTVRLPHNEIVDVMGYQLQFVDMIDNPKGFDCHVEVMREDETFTAVLNHEFPKNQDGVMRKPDVEKYWSYDLYLAPVAMEEAGGEDPSILTFEKNQSRQIDKYTLTFHEFELSSHEADGPTRAIAKMTVSYYGNSEDIAPQIIVIGDSVVVEPAFFDDDQGELIVAGIQPETGSLAIKVIGDFVPNAEVTQATLIIELSEKPLINLFWLGTILCFLSGTLSMRERRKRNMMETSPVNTVDIKKEMAS